MFIGDKQFQPLLNLIDFRASLLLNDINSHIYVNSRAYLQNLQYQLTSKIRSKFQDSWYLSKLIFISVGTYELSLNIELDELVDLFTSLIELLQYKDPKKIIFLLPPAQGDKTGI